eukprot:5290514-Amphidinium_carterae.1
MLLAAMLVFFMHAGFSLLEPWRLESTSRLIRAIQMHLPTHASGCPCQLPRRNILRTLRTQSPGSELVSRLERNDL